VKAFVIKKQRSSICWAFDAAVFPIYAAYAIRHFTNVIELICNLQPFVRVETAIYIGCCTFQMAIPDSHTVPFIIFFPTQREYPKDANDSPVARYLKQIFFFRLPEM